MNSFLLENITDPLLLSYLTKADAAVRGIGHQIEFTHDFKDMGMEKADWQDVTDSVTKSVAHRHLNDLVLDVPINGLEIFADPWLTRVFLNLADNTLQHAEHATTITVSYTESRNGVVLVYEDDGIGIPMENKEKIFEQGFGKNHGYGLFMAREILAITGLTIRECGEPGKGVRFEIHVPKTMYRLTSER
jgi:signal transduction histidine kinase